MAEKFEGGREKQIVNEKIKEGIMEYEVEMGRVIPPEDLRVAEELVSETEQALVEVREKQQRTFIDEETQLPKVGGNFGFELKEAVMARRIADKNYDNGTYKSLRGSNIYGTKESSEAYKREVIENWDKSKKHIENVGKMIADALEKGKSGVDFRSALPYFIGHIGGVAIVFRSEGGSSKRPFPTEYFRKTIEQFLPEDSKWMSHDVVSSVIGHLFPQEEIKE